MATSETNLSDAGIASQPATAGVSGFFSHPVGWALCLALLLAVGILRIVATYRVFNHTIDEPSHLACGIEWWEKGVYTIETKHTPLARISVAFLPYLSGLRAPAQFHTWEQTYPILSADGHYWRNLSLARIGVLPYFIIATLVVFFWTKRLYGAPAGLLAAAILTFLPTMLAHSSLATTDVAFTAMFCWAMYSFTLWLKQPNAKTAAIFGVLSGLALCAKFSTVVFIPGCSAAILLMYAVAGQAKWRTLLSTVAVSLLCAFLVTWAIYRFSHAPLGQVTAIPDRVAATAFGKSSNMTAIARKIASRIPVPAPEIPDGIRTLREQNRKGTRAYLLGHLREGGFWYFFFVALAVKTPLAVLLLGALGTGVVVARYLGDRSDWQSAAPLAFTIVIMIVTMPSRIDTGLRYVLPVYLFFSMLAGLGVVTLWEQREHRMLGRATAVVLLSWLAVSSVLAHPDYLAYFNEFGGKDPSRLLVVGDLDWGQDLTRLSVYLRENQINHISIAYEGFYDPDSLGLPDTVKMKCGDIASGWVAVAARRARRFPECWPWLPRQHRVAIVGKTMWIYHLDEQQ